MRPLWITLVAALALPGCTVAGNAAEAGGDAQRIVIGYQSKTINTVTAGTLLRSRGYFEKRLAELGKKNGTKYAVTWQDYDTGAPITAQMLAGKIDIGSMGDYPLLINGARGQQNKATRTKLVALTGYNARGALNMVVTAPGSTAKSLRDLKGKAISASVGSAGHGTLVQALRKESLDPQRDVKVQNQQPPVGASALQSGNVAALAQFVAWPGLLVYKKQANLLYDGSALDVPTLHGVVVREKYASDQPDVLRAFLQAQLDATKYLRENPLAASETVAKATGLPVEVVYLYNGAGGMVSFDATIKAKLTAALAHDVPFLKSIGVLQTLDLDAFIDDGPIREAYGASYDADASTLTNRAPITGTDPVCGRPVDDPKQASEVWLAGQAKPQPAATPTCLLRAVRKAGAEPRAAYVPDAATGTRWFADHSVWVADPAAAADARFKPFTTTAGAQSYVAAHPGAAPVPYAQAVREAG